VFAGDAAQFQLFLESRTAFARHSLDLRCREATTRCDVPAHGAAAALVPLKAERRGWLQLERVTVETRFPLGLMRAWSYVQPDMRALVYPRPDSSPLPETIAIPDAGETVSAGAGTDDFAGLRPYQASDSPRHIAWKASARSESLLTKAFAGQAASELWFDWERLPPDMGTEARLSRLARWVLLAEEHGLRYGLKLPDGARAVPPFRHGRAQRSCVVERPRARCRSCPWCCCLQALSSRSRRTRCGCPGGSTSSQEACSPGGSGLRFAAAPCPRGGFSRSSPSSAQSECTFPIGRSWAATPASRSWCCCSP
jgi:uncharacterized protein (DUF58 family)